MNWITPLLLFVVTWLTVFASTQFAPLAGWLGMPLSLVPGVIVYAALTNHLLLTTGLCVFAGLGLDALSANRLGVSVMPMFLAGFFIQQRRHLILREQAYAQFWLGFATAVFVPVATWLIMLMGQREPLRGWSTVWQLALGGAINGLLCPAWFLLFDALRRTFDYQPVAESSFRSDRQIKRGRF